MDTIAIIMAGGKGTRISSIRSDIPKPMIEVCGKPVLAHQIACLKENGITEIVLVVGHLGEIIQRYFGDGSNWGVKIHYIVEAEPLGTAGALYYLNGIKSDFFVINGDIIFDVNLDRMLAFHREKRAEITLFAHPNCHPNDSSILVRDMSGRVVRWCKTESHTVRNCVNAGIHVLSPCVLDDIENPVPKSLDRDLIAGRLIRGTVYAYQSPEYVHDMGTPDRYEAVCRDVKSELVQAKNLKWKQKAVFLDRDGTINTNCGYITVPDQIALEPGAAEAIKTINQSGYLAIVITNQPVIARGDCTTDQLEKIHGRLEFLLGREGAYLDDICYCPHHPDRGFPGEQLDYKIDCPCRKPKPGLLFQAADRYHIDLSASYMIGDNKRDIQAGQCAGCTTVLLAKGQTESSGADKVFSNLAEAIKSLLPCSIPCKEGNNG